MVNVTVMSVTHRGLVGIHGKSDDVQAHPGVETRPVLPPESQPDAGLHP